MYISLDMDKMVLLHKHEMFDTVSDLDYLADRGLHTTLFPVSHRLSLDNVSEDKLKRLYVNMHGPSPTPFGSALRAACWKLVDSFAPTVCDPVDVLQRADRKEGTQPRVKRDAAHSTPAAPRAPRVPGGSRKVIFEVAEVMWLAAGKPDQLPALLTLRKIIMETLEREHGIARTTSSTALGEWQKGKVL